VVHEKNVVEHYGDFDEVPEYGDENDLFERTVELMRKESKIIYHGRLNGRRLGRVVPDLLFKTSLPAWVRRSKLGEYSLRTVRY